MILHHAFVLPACRSFIRRLHSRKSVRRDCVVPANRHKNLNLFGVKSEAVLESAKMTVTPKISVNDGNLVVHGKTILSGVPDNIMLTPGSGVGLVAGAFIGATTSHSKSIHVIPVGVLEDVRFMCSFRFKLWWMTQRMGTCGKDIPLETQFLLIESKDTTAAVRKMPQLSTPSSCLFLKGHSVQFFKATTRISWRSALTVGTMLLKPTKDITLFTCKLGRILLKVVEKHMQTFHHRVKKKLPGFLDWFGWCTWDAFYTDVTAEGVEEGLKSLSEGGAPPPFLIIDDGWQQIGNETKNDPNCVVQEGAQFANRLIGIKENAKFQKNGRADDQEPGPKLVVKDAKQQHNVKHFSHVTNRTQLVSASIIEFQPQCITKQAVEGWASTSSCGFHCTIFPLSPIFFANLSRRT
ncbi:hypothetical protein ACS0TY_013125 [Phlomoides rotata]